MKKINNVRVNVLEEDSGKVTGHFDVAVTSQELKELGNILSSISKDFGSKYIFIISRCPTYDELDKRLDKIIELLRRKLHE